MQNSVAPNQWVDFIERYGLHNRSVYALGFNPHWRKSLGRFTRGSQVNHVRSAGKIPESALVLVWGQRPVELHNSNIKLVRLEDGFLRSVGLGAEFAQPLSWVVDFNHLYFDATGPSRLEQLLQNHPFTETERQRANSLIQAIRAAGLSKYNTATEAWARPAKEHVILVPGQVETDASLAYGAPGIKTNMELLKTVRQQNPDAWIAYKPHPDVNAGARKPGKEEEYAGRWCNEIVTRAGIASILEQVDEVHTLTSLAGFEALIRNKPVTCYGLPFYAGWGLTKDIQPCDRRNRKLSVEEMAYAALIEYPLYVSLNEDSFITPEEALEELQYWRGQKASVKSEFGKVARKAINLIMGAK